MNIVPDPVDARDLTTGVMWKSFGIFTLARIGTLLVHPGTGEVRTVDREGYPLGTLEAEAVYREAAGYFARNFYTLTEEAS